ncbi:peptidoglycan-binding domain-containing protein [Pseudomonas brassicacearum]|uniref:peptidoglycan-binding domain-containing protein n=1 Tax=Pseudomonas brassicacearum TaxID=930166 RepID=UPI001BDF0191|nr:peptidoglycan-binding protein [Pseudomonas brassicacearum]
MNARSDPGGDGIVLALGATESVDSVAYAYGHARSTLWDHPRNAELRRQHPDGTTLATGDLLFVPPRTTATFEQNATGRRHTFRVLNTPAMLRFRPYALAGQGLARHFEVLRGGALLGRGTAEANGDIVWPLEPTADDITVRVTFDGFLRDYRLRLRALDPISTLKGVQQRLCGLGYFNGECDGQMNDATRVAIDAFKMQAGLPDDDELLSDAVRATLHGYHGEASL